MNNISEINPETIDTIEKYATSLLFSMITIQTLEKFHTNAFKCGILEEDEAELMTTICWELRRLMGLMTKQFESVSERVNMDEALVLKSLAEIVSGVKTKKPRVKRTKKAGGKNETTT